MARVTGAICLAALSVLQGCSNEPAVVVYTSVDQISSEPVLGWFDLVGRNAILGGETSAGVFDELRATPASPFVQGFVESLHLSGPPGE